jgi:hypothetical protein
MKTILDVIETFFCLFLLVAGIFLCIVGPLNGFGTPTVAMKLLVTVGGIVCISAGMAILYYSSGRNWQTTFEKLLNVIFFGL